jgi:hypothetical protein
MHACVCPGPCLCVVSISSTARLLHGSVPLLCVLQHGLVCYIVFFGSLNVRWSVLLAARVYCCSGSLSAVFVTCAGVMLYDESGYPTKRPGGVGDTSPARGRPVAHIMLCPLLRVRVFR